MDNKVNEARENIIYKSKQMNFKTGSEILIRLLN